MGQSLRTVFLTALFTVSLAASGAAQKFEYKEYTVKPGDTLWDITKNELRDAFQWPMVWKENLRINNPDLIYPGQVINIPVRVISQDVTTLALPEEVSLPAPEPEPEVALPEELEELPAFKPSALEAREVKIVRAEPLITREALLESGYITRRMPYEGEISGSAINRTLFSQDDEVYVKTRADAEAGKKFYVLRKGKKVQHPVTGRNLGNLVSVVGTLVLEESGRKGLKARILEAFDSIRTGDVLDRYYEIRPPFVGGEARRPEVEAVVVAAKYLRVINATFDVVFIDKGKDYGLREGDIVMTLFPGTDDMRNSVIQLVNLRRKTALGVIVKSEWEVKKGDIVVGMR